MFVEVARVEDDSKVGSSGKVSVLEKVVLVLLAVEAGAVKEGLALKAGSRSCHYGVCHQGLCHQGGCRQGEFGILLSRWVGVRVLESRSKANQPRFSLHTLYVDQVSCP